MTRLLRLTTLGLFGGLASLSAAAQPASSVYQFARDAGASAAAAAGLAAAMPPAAQEARLVSDDAEAGDFFGVSVSIFGDRALVGAREDNDNGTDSGSAYVFVRSGSTWTQEAKLTPTDGAEGDFFGVSVSLSDSRALIGVSRDDDNDTNSGSAYVFVRSGSSWTQEAKLTASDGEEFAAFGDAVSLSGDRALVGARSLGASGAAYVFVRSGSVWTQEAKLTTSDAEPSSEFGYSVSLSDDRALIGARNDETVGGSSGAAYVFARSGSAWTQEARLTAGLGDVPGNFGYSVSLSGDRALVGTGQEGSDGDGGFNRGSAYVFVRSGSAWAQEARLVADDAANNDQFGYSVSLSGDRALIGARNDDDDGSNSGSGYVFARSGTTWVQEDKITPDNSLSGFLFGFSVSLSGSRALVGALGARVAGVSSGAAYVFTVGPEAIEAVTSAGEGWRMVSAPIGGLTVGSLTDLNLVAGIPGDPQCAGALVNLYTGYAGGAVAGTTAGYVAPTSYDDPLTPGRGAFWYFYDDPADAGPCGSGATASSVQPLPLTLSATGTAPSADVTTTFTASERAPNDDTFYLAGNPFGDGLDLDGTAAGLTSITGTDANGAVAFQNTVQVWDPSFQGYFTLTAADDAGTDGTGGSFGFDNLAAWQGLWLERSAGGSPAYPLTVTYQSEYSGGPGLFVGRHSDPPGLRTLRFEVTGTVDGTPVYDGAASVLFADGASDAWDAYDASKLDALASPSALLAPVGLDRDGALTQKAAESLPYDVAGAIEVPLSFMTSGAGDFELRWPQTESIPEEWTLVLTDSQTGQSIDLRTTSAYAFESGATAGWTDRFSVTVERVTVGTEDRFSDGVAISRAYPNPARQTATVTVQVTQAQSVRAEVFTLLGRRVAVVHDGALASGVAVPMAVDVETLAAGTYIVRITGEAFVESRRLTVVR